MLFWICLDVLISFTDPPRTSISGVKSFHLGTLLFSLQRRTNKTLGYLYLFQGLEFHSGGLGLEGVFARRRVCIRNQAQPFETVRNRSREVGMAVPPVSAAKAVAFGGFKRGATLFRVASVALRDSTTCFITCRKSFCVTGAILLRRFQQISSIFSWQAQHFGDIRVDFAWQAQHFTRLVLRAFCDIFRAASSSDNVQIACGKRGTLWEYHFAWQRQYLVQIRRVCVCGNPHSTLYTLHSTLYAFHFTLGTSHSTLYTPHFTLDASHSTLHTLHSTLYTLHFTHYTLHPALYNLHFTLYTLHFTLQTLHFTLHALHLTLHTQHFTLHTLHFTLDNRTWQPTFDTLHFTLYTPGSTLYTLHFPLCTWHSTLYTLHLTFDTPHSPLYTLHSLL